MAEASLIPIAKSLLARLGPYASEKIELWWGARDDLRKLMSSIGTIKAGLLDAERRQGSRDQDSELVREWIRRLRNVLYDADDLFDRVFTIEEGKQKLSRKDRSVRELKQFFSKYNHMAVQAEIARKVKEIREELDGIKSDMTNFAFSCNLVENSLCYERENMGPVNVADAIIGREEDEGILMELLMDATSKEEGLADVIAIVGFGGLGKTTLAQLLYNNKVVKENFESRPWACISDVEGKMEKAKIILGALQTAESIGSTERSNRLNVHEIQVDELEQEIQARVRNKKYLLVVDDYWDEDRNTWLYLVGLLRGGRAGSKIIVTTRSSKVALAVGVYSPHLLKGLEDEKAWELFKKLAFRSATDAENQHLIVMGKKIVEKCKNVPLAIKAIACVLYTCCDDESKWKSIMDSDMLTLERTYRNLNILPVLKLSYDHLPSHLKHCFAFCSIFPKDFEMDGEKLIYYWISQGYVEQRPDTVQSGLMQIGESYLKELMATSFLQKDRERLWGGRYGYYKMHDLMHDLAKEMAGEEVVCIQSSKNWPGPIVENHASNNARIRHLSLISCQNQQTFIDGFQSEREKYLRSLIFAYSQSSTIGFKALSNLRLLDMNFLGIKSLCDSVGELKHLRSLILSNNGFRHLPKSICKLHNLKILDLYKCSMLQTLPRDMNKLINLTCLRVEDCISLKGMPCKFGELSSLESLDEYVVGESPGKYNNGLEALAGLVNLGGKRLVIQFLYRGGGMVRKNDGQKRVDLSSSLSHLDKLDIRWANVIQKQSGWACETEWDTELVEFLCSNLPSNLKKLDLCYFPGRVIPEWKAFGNLEELYLSSCNKCRYLPSFGERPRLKVLNLQGLDELEYIQMGENDELAAETHGLVGLMLHRLPKLKAWSPGMEKLARRHISSSPHDAIAAFPHFQYLTELRISNCYELMSLPLPAKHVPPYIVGVLKEPLKTLLKASGNSQTTGLSSSTRPTAIMMCHHNIPAAMGISWDPGQSFGKRFYGCGKWKEDSCKFFCWIDVEQYGPRALQVINLLKKQNEDLRKQCDQMRGCLLQLSTASDALEKLKVENTELKEIISSSRRTTRSQAEESKRLKESETRRSI